MTDRHLPDRSSVRELADRLNRTLPPQIKMTGSSTPGGRDKDTIRNGLPMPIGTEGQVVTVVDVAGDLVPQWADSTGSSGGQYRFPLYSTFGGGELLFDSDGHLMYTLEDLE